MGSGEVILLDTHVWVWWCHDAPALPNPLRSLLKSHEGEGFAISAISVWEVAKLVERGRLELPFELDAWLPFALDGSGISLLPLSPQISVASTRLPGEFHRDPADQIIVATSRTEKLRLATCDQRIIAYPHVSLLSDDRIHDA